MKKHKKTSFIGGFFMHSQQVEQKLLTLGIKPYKNLRQHIGFSQKIKPNWHQGAPPVSEFRPLVLTFLV